MDNLETTMSKGIFSLEKFKAGDKVNIDSYHVIEVNDDVANTTRTFDDEPFQFQRPADMSVAAFRETFTVGKTVAVMERAAAAGM